MSIELVPKEPLVLTDIFYYIYYDEYTGNITAVCSTPDDTITDPYLKKSLDETDAPSLIIAGKKHVHDFMVAYNDDDKLDILGKGDVLRWTRKSTVLKKIPVNLAKKPAEHLDIQFIYHRKSNIVRLIVNDRIRQRISDPLGNKQFRIKSGKNLSVFVCSKNDPDFIHDTIDFPLEDLIREKELIYEDFAMDLSDKYQLYTGDSFKNIRFDITNAEYVASPFADGIVQRIVTVEKENPNVLSHISMHQKSEDELEIINKVADMKDLKQFDPEFTIFISHDDPDEYEGQLIFDVKDLQKDRPKTFKIPIDLRDKTLMYRGSRMRVTLRG